MSALVTPRREGRVKRARGWIIKVDTVAGRWRAVGLGSMSDVFGPKILPRRHRAYNVPVFTCAYQSINRPSFHAHRSTIHLDYSMTILCTESSPRPSSVCHRYATRPLGVMRLLTTGYASSSPSTNALAVPISITTSVYSGLTRWKSSATASLAFSSEWNAWPTVTSLIDSGLNV